MSGECRTLPYMARTARLEVRLEPDLRARVEARAEESGQSLTVFVERALESALNGQGSGDTSSVSSPRGSGSAKETAPTEPSASSRTSKDIGGRPYRSASSAEAKKDSRPIPKAGKR